jgi:hypothetical protein
MKRILTAAAALLFSVAIFAQANDGPPPPGAPRAKTPMTPEQRAKRETDRINSVTPLGASYQKVLDVCTKRNELSDDQKGQLKALSASHRKNIQAAMGPDLYAKYEAARKAQAEERKNGAGGPPPSDK